jgi:hypothetical protein
LVSRSMQPSAWTRRATSRGCRKGGRPGRGLSACASAWRKRSIA